MVLCMKAAITIQANNKDVPEIKPCHVCFLLEGVMPMNPADPTSYCNNNQRINIDSVFVLVWRGMYPCLRYLRLHSLMIYYILRIVIDINTTTAQITDNQGVCTHACDVLCILGYTAGDEGGHQKEQRGADPRQHTIKGWVVTVIWTGIHSQTLYLFGGKISLYWQHVWTQRVNLKCQPWSCSKAQKTQQRRHRKIYFLLWCFMLFLSPF